MRRFCEGRSGYNIFLYYAFILNQSTFSRLVEKIIELPPNVVGSIPLLVKLSIILIRIFQILAASSKTGKVFLSL